MPRQTPQAPGEFRGFRGFRGNLSPHSRESRHEVEWQLPRIDPRNDPAAKRRKDSTLPVLPLLRDYVFYEFMMHDAIICNYRINYNIRLVLSCSTIMSSYYLNPILPSSSSLHPLPTSSPSSFSSQHPAVNHSSIQHGYSREKRKATRPQLPHNCRARKTCRPPHEQANTRLLQ